MRGCRWPRLAAALAALAACSLFAATHRVPAHFPSIQDAIDAAADGDEILVSPGTWRRYLDFRGKDLTLRSEGGPDLTFLTGGYAPGSPPPPPGPRPPVVSIGPAGAVIGFTITDPSAPSIVGGMAIVGAGTLVRGNVFADNFGGAILGVDASPHVEANVFRRNECPDFPNQAAMLFRSSAGFSSPRIVNNVVHDNPSCAAVNTVGARPVPGAPGTILNNTLVGNRVGLLPAWDCVHLYRNNIAFGNATGVQVGGNFCALTPPPVPLEVPWLDHNLVWNNGTDYQGVADQTGVNGNIAGDPLFTNPQNGDFRIETGSAAIDAGNDELAPDADFEGTPRPQDGDGDAKARTDIGAYEATVTLGADIWWVPSESGWGISITQHANRQIFAIWYIYDAEGRPIWYTIPDGFWRTPFEFAGTLYVTTGAPYFGAEFDSTRVRNHKVGDASLRFHDRDNATFEFFLGGARGEKRIMRQRYGAAGPAPVYGDLWWNEREPGWGIAINQQGETIFATWYVYDENGVPQWLVMPGGTWNGSSYTGNVYATRGPRSIEPFDPALVERRIVGTATLTFESASSARLDFDIGGVSGSRPITRQPF